MPQFLQCLGLNPARQAVPTELNPQLEAHQPGVHPLTLQGGQRWRTLGMASVWCAAQLPTFALIPHPQSLQSDLETRSCPLYPKHTNTSHLVKFKLLQTIATAACDPLSKVGDPALRWAAVIGGWGKTGGTWKEGKGEEQRGKGGRGLSKPTGFPNKKPHNLHVLDLSLFFPPGQQRSCLAVVRGIYLCGIMLPCKHLSPEGHESQGGPWVSPSFQLLPATKASSKWPLTTCDLS